MITLLIDSALAMAQPSTVCVISAMNGRPEAPSVGNYIAHNLVNELKQADSIQAANLKIQTSKHD